MSLVELTDIAQELKNQWDQAQGENKTRASLFNLIVYVEKNERTAQYRSLIHSVISKFPCRVIFIIYDQGTQQEYLKTQVSTQTIRQGSHPIFCEQITIEAAGSLQERVYFLLLPHLLCDLPIYLLWTLDPLQNHPLLSRFEKMATRIIFDSQGMRNLQEYAKNTLTIMKRFHCEIGDLNWSALSGWRTILRNFFDTPQTHQLLLDSKKIEIAYAISAKALNNYQEVEAAYLQAWLAGLFHWQPRSYSSSEGYQRIAYDTLEGECVVLLKGQEQHSLLPGSLISIEFESKEEATHLAFNRKGNKQVFTNYSDKNRCDLPHCSYLPGIEEGKEIVKEIFYPSQKEHYQKMLTMLSRISWRTL